MKFKLLILLAPVLASACAVSGPAVIAPLGPAPSVDGGSYSSGGGLAFATSLVQVNGRAAICGVRSEVGRQSVLTKDKANQVASTGSAYVDGQLLHRSLTFMRRVAPQQSYAGAEGHCVLTNRAWQPGDETRAVELRIPRQIVYREGDELIGSGPIITFKQTGAPSSDNLIRSTLSGL